MSCCLDGYLIQRTAPWNPFVRKLNLGPNMPMPLTQSSNTNTSYLLLQLYRYTKSECYIVIRTDLFAFCFRLNYSDQQLNYM